MKKVLALLFAIVMCLSIVSCGGENGKSNESKKEENKIERPSDLPVGEVEVTLDNWQKYFNMVEIVEARTNSFDEIENSCVVIHISLKDEYVKFCKESKIAFELKLTDPKMCTVEGNYKTGKFEITKTYTLDELKEQGNEYLLEYYAESKPMGEYHIYNNIMDDGLKIAYHYPQNNSLTSSGENVKFDVVLHDKLEVLRVKGTLNFVENPIDKLDI